MAEEQLHRVMVWAVIATALPTFLYLFRKTAPYGRHYAGAGWGPHISSRLGWIIMELPAVVVFIAIYLNGEGRIPHRAAALSGHVAGSLSEPDVHLPVSDPGERTEDAVAGDRIGLFLQCD